MKAWSTCRPPVRVIHAEKHGDLLRWLRGYSEATPGVSVLDNANLARRALLDGDFGAVLAELSKGLDTPEHAAFAARLKADRGE